ncbi:hypothetical protein BST27_20045 [Mycobacterium intermedium]|uniref:DUF475 domain-containing protein n=1 Tax=Mycobacterium intermedium TaxID=28445 RepID=A0A1E3SER1_MYCIE|nr:DUF475 domain-containing protein [Mycobacterium intermedium]MCV6965543.1 DUF475 domain-containing protein [Mycobacterium intermedium]ODR00620.1 hypothetical protein BHQ20_12270 [Mycobacterium intermedium]OPE48957.1 hypothetical protein BV508_16070 [Mycobacterium intermedium]ORA98998.1 hypothetical protein BST27_20045 [Mycobacterium intermedium]
MTTFRIFATSLVVTVAALVGGFLYGGPKALFLLVVLGLLEISLSFDNAIINATVLKRMSPFWQRMFLTVGIVIAVFGMRLLFPLVIVWVSADLDPVRALRLALGPPPGGALEFPDGSPSYEKLVQASHPQIAAFGGMFLLMLFLDFIFHDREIKWLTWIEAPFARAGRLGQLPAIVGGTTLILVGMQLTHGSEERATVMTAGVLGMVVYLLVNGLSRAFRPPGIDDEDEDSQEPSQQSKALAKAGFTLFLYLEVLDAAFSFDGVTGAFAITTDPIIIALGLGLVGAIFVRSITIYLVRQDTLDTYEYLEHGAHWAIGALALIMLASVDHRLHVPEWFTASVGITLIAASFLWSLRSNRKKARA